MKKLSATQGVFLLFFVLMSHILYAQNCSPDRMPPVFDMALGCDTVNCGDPLPTTFPTASDACSAVSLFEEAPMANGNYTCQGSFLVYGMQDMPDEHYVLTSHAPLDTITGISVNGLNGIGYYCNDTTGAHLYGLWTLPTNRTDTFVLGKSPQVWFTETNISGGQVALIDTLPNPPVPVAGPDQIAFTGPSVHSGDVGGGNFYFTGISGLLDTVTLTLVEVHLYIGTIPLGDVCALQNGLNVSYTEINLDAVCTGYFAAFAAQVSAYLNGLISFPSGGFQDWAANNAGTTLYTFLGVENALMRIDVATGNATCTPGPASNVTNGYVGMTGVQTDEMAGMYFDAMGTLHAFQSDRGRIFSVNLGTAELTFVDTLNLANLRGDAASCRDCSNAVYGPCPVAPVQRRIIRATDASNNANYNFQYIFPKDTSAPVLMCMDTTVVLHMGCDTIVTLHAPAATDNCNSDSLTFMVVSPTPISSTDTSATFMLSVGNNTIMWAAMDCAGNISTCTMNAKVIQPVAPDAVCKNTNISLGDPCSIKVTPIMVYAGDTTNFCPSNFEITLRDKYHQIIPGNIVTGAYVGQVLEVTLTVVQNGNSCWGTMLVEDKFPPTISCQNDTMDCLTFVHNFIPPIASDNCSTAEAIKVDEKIIPMPCDTYFIKRIVQKWVARDAYGTLSRDTCTRSILVRRLSLDSVLFPMDTVLDCNAGFATLPNGAPDPMVTGVPMVGDIPIYPNPDVYCNVLVTFRDDVIPEVGCRSQVVRVWRVEELWCNGNPVRTMTQVLTVIDTTGPELVLDKEVIHATTERRSCTANVWLPPVITLKDACHKVSGLLIHYPGGVLKTDGGWVNLPVGTHWAVYEAFDACYNRTKDSIQIIVRDQTPPVAVCKTFTTVSLDNLGNAWARAQDLDQGSFDECALDHFEVRRMSNLPCIDTPSVWGPSVRFCCEDVGTQVMVAFRAIDKSQNAGTCMVSVLVQDKLPPVVKCLPDITVDCRFDWDPEHLEVFGELVAHDSLRKPIVIDADSVRFSGPAFDGVASDNCPMTVTEELDTSDINMCGLGTIIRRFKVTDAQGSMNTSCIQQITVINAHPITQDSIIWPKDYLLADSCSLALFDPAVLPDSSNYPKLQDDECSLIGWDFTDDTLRNVFAVDACVKVIRHWRGIDWCQKDPVTGSFLKWDSVQILKLINTVAPTITSSCQDTMKCSYDPNCGPASITLSATATDDCTPAADLFWQYQIDLGNDGTYDIYGRDSNHVTGTFPIDTHRIRWIVEDKCGNITDCSYTFELRNCKAPTAYCKTDVVFELDSVDTNGDGHPDAVQSRAVASDFDDGSFHPCGYPVALSFSADTTDTLKIFSCPDLGIVPLELWVTDKVNGNTSKCVLQAVVQDNNGDCVSPLKGDISGALIARNGEQMEGVEVYLDHSGGQMVHTDKAGKFLFGDMPFGGSYRVRPTYDKDVRNGVSTRDLVKIKKYLLGHVSFNDPLDYIAADVNRDRHISTADLLAIRRVILHKSDAYNNNKSWRFITEDYKFPDPQDPFKYSIPESYDFDPFDESAQVSFTGIKIGDVTGDAHFNLQSNSPRGEASVELVMKDLQLKKGQRYEIPVYLSDILRVEGLQLTLDFNPKQLEVLNLLPNKEIGLSESNFNFTQLDKGMLPMSWVKSGGVISKHLFTLVIEAKHDNMLSELFGVSDRFIRAEAYFTGYEMVGKVKMAFRTQSGQVAKDNFFTLYQNRPNPWSDITTIGFYLPEEQDAQLSVWSHTGKLLKIIQGHYPAGYSEVHLDRAGLPRSGTLIYEIKTEKYKATKKMVLME